MPLIGHGLLYFTPTRGIFQARHFTHHTTANVLTESGRPWKNHDMTAEQVIRELRLLRYDRKPSIRGVAIQAGVDRKPYTSYPYRCLSQP